MQENAPHLHTPNPKASLLRERRLLAAALSPTGTPTEITFDRVDRLLTVLFSAYPQVQSPFEAVRVSAQVGTLPANVGKVGCGPRTERTLSAVSELVVQNLSEAALRGVYGIGQKKARTILSVMNREGQ